MLPDRDCQLLTAFVDGELNERQHEALLRLLRESPEARLLLQDLEDNAGKLKALPAQTLGPDFSRAVLHRIKTLPASGARPKQAAGRIAGWVGPAAAAAILLAVAGVSYWFFSPPQQLPVVNIEPKEDRSPLVAKIIEGTVKRFADPAMQVNMADFAQEKTQTRLTDELKKQNAVHLELACKNSAQAVDGLSNALQKSGVNVLVDDKAKSQLKSGATVVLVYAENLRAEELTEILSRLGAREQIKNVIDRQFASVHIESLSPEYRDRVARRFGMDGKQLQPPPRGDLEKFIAAPPKVKGKKTGPDSVPPPRQADKFALVFAADDAENGAVSTELQRFLQTHRRQQGTPGTLQIVLVVRPDSV